MNKLAQTTVKAIGWSGITFALGNGVRFLSTVILVRLLAPKEFGLMALGLLATNYLSKLNFLGIGPALIYHQEEPEQTASVAFTLNLLLGVLLTGVAFLAAPLIAAFFREPRLTMIVRVLSAWFVIISLGGIHLARLRKALDFRRRLIPLVSHKFGKSCVAIILAVAGFGVWSLVWGQLAGGIIAVILLWTVERWCPRLTFDPGIARRLLSYGTQTGLLNILNSILANADYLIIGRRMDAVLLGFYTVAFRLPQIVVSGIQPVVGPVLFPAYIRFQNDGNSLNRAFLTTLQYISLITVPLGLGMAIVAPEFVEVFYTTDWMPTAPVMQALAVYAMIKSLSASTDHVYKATGRLAVVNQIAILRILIAVPILWIAAGHSIFHVAVGQILISLMTTIVQLGAISHILDIRFTDLWAAFRPALLGGGIMLSGILTLRLQISSFSPLIRLLLLSGCGAAVYVGTLWFTNRPLFQQALAILRTREETL